MLDLERLHSLTAELLRRSSKGDARTFAVYDVLIVFSSVAVAYALRFDGEVPQAFRPGAVLAAVLFSALFVGVCRPLGLYHHVWKYVGLGVILRLALAVSVVAWSGTLLVMAFDSVYRFRPVPISIPVLAMTFAFIASSALRGIGRLSVFVTAAEGSGRRRVLVVGAGDAGSLLLQDIENQPGLGLKVVGFLDDDVAKHGRFVRGVRVLGGIETLPEAVGSHAIDEVFVAMPSATFPERRRAIELCEKSLVRARIMSNIAEATGRFSDMRPVDIEDLLGREPVTIDIRAVAETLTDRVVAVTGAAGSIGSELCRQILKMKPRRLLLMEIDETRLYELYLELSRFDPTVPSMIVGDVREPKVASLLATEQADVLFHAAAYKHVPLMELAPDEAVLMNVYGTKCVLQACEQAGVKHFVLISTDKAVEPVNVMGASKALAERLTLEAARRGLSGTIVRFGNVLGSRGSVIPLFEEQLRCGGPVRVTHPDVTRYFMTIPEAARLVLQAQAMSKGGELYVLEMGEPVRIVDVARRMISLSGSDARIEYDGLRPGEKLHEVLVHENEQLMPTECEKVMQLNALPACEPAFERRISELIALARANMPAEVIEKIEELLPGFAASRMHAYGCIDEFVYKGEELDACCLVH